MAEHSEKRRNLELRNPAGGSEPAVDRLPDELAVAILSRVGTLNEAARCSSLLSKRWRHMWRLIDGGIVDLEKSDELFRRTIPELPFFPCHDKEWREYISHEERTRFADWVNQALSCLAGSQELDGLRIGFDLFGMDEDVGRWVEFGLTRRVKELALSCCLPFSEPFFRVALCAKSITKHDLSRLEVLQLQGVDISQAALGHIFSTCISMRRFALRDSTCYERDMVIRVCSSRSLLESLKLKNLYIYGVRIELISAPRLSTVEVDLDAGRVQVEFGDDLPQLREARFKGRWMCQTERYYLPWSRSDQFGKVAAQLHRVGLQLGRYHFFPYLNPPSEWLLFEKLKVLDLFISVNPESILDCSVLIRRCPVLRELSVWFKEECYVSSSGNYWVRRDIGPKSSTWKHHSLQVLRLHGVYSVPGGGGDDKKIRLDLAAYIIKKAPSLNQVLIDTRHPELVFGPVESRLPQQVELDTSQAKMELETLLQARSACTSQIHFTYR